MHDRTRQYNADYLESDPTWEQLGARIRQLAAELLEEIRNDPDSAGIAVCILSDLDLTFDASRN